MRRRVCRKSAVPPKSHHYHPFLAHRVLASMSEGTCYARHSFRVMIHTGHSASRCVVAKDALREAGSVGQELPYRMDPPYVQPVVGLHQGLSGLQILLRGGLGSKNRRPFVGAACSAPFLRRAALEGTAQVECRSRCTWQPFSGVLRLDGQRV
jgi:hypothetical protein